MASAGAAASRKQRQEEDAEIVQRIADGDQYALGELYDRFAPLLISVTRRVLGDPEDADEVVQETLLQVWKQAGRYRQSRSAVSTWLVLLARSRAIDRLRSRQSHSRALTALRQDQRDPHTSAEATGSVLMEERRHRIFHELKELPDSQRQVLELAYYGGLSQSQIAEQEGIPLGTVKTRTLLALKKLREALNRDRSELL
ncbi:MAG: sigma-70 family RNA polymerase sigma factor [Acidobacteriota bacterium]